MTVSTYLADIWSATDFRRPGLADYAEQRMRTDTRHGVQIMALLSLAMQFGVLLLVPYQLAASSHAYTHMVLGALSVHILVSAHFVQDIRALQGLGIVLLIVSALAITFLAHRAGEIDIGMMAAIIMLFIAIPLVPWGLRETALVIGLTYLLLTSSLVSVPGRFELETFWSLQLLVLGVTIIVTVVIGRNTFIRKEDFRIRFALENAHREMELLSQKDHLTGAWNRRFLDTRFPQMVDECREHHRKLHVAVLDIDDFKNVNDHYGHQFADQVLVRLAKIFIKHLQDQGSLIRLGGDEFQILYCGDDLNSLIGDAVAELQDTPLAEGAAKDRTITLSAGIATTGPDQFTELHVLYKIADRALYAAKSKRSRKTVCASVVEPLAQTGSWSI